MNQVSSENKYHYKTWTTQEDDALLRGYSKYGKKWQRIVNEFLPNKGYKQVRERYTLHLDPNIDRSAWSQEGLVRLMELGEEYGHSWKFIAENFFPGRTTLDLKNHYWSLIRVKKRKRDVTEEHQAKRARIDNSEMAERERLAVSYLLEFRTGNYTHLTSVPVQDPAKLTEEQVESINQSFFAKYY